VRYYEKREGRKVQRSIYLGADPQLVHRVRRLLQQWRLISQWATKGDREAQAFAGLVRQAVQQAKGRAAETPPASP
jgi:hypothetical protein